jgi:hypothetical protein
LLWLRITSLLRLTTSFSFALVLNSVELDGSVILVIDKSSENIRYRGSAFPEGMWQVFSGHLAG